MKKEDLSPLQKELLAFYKEIRKLFSQNKISYSAAAGSLIGTIREKGFIPWDDDIDLFLLRPDFEELMDIARKNNNKVGDFDVYCAELGNSALPFCKIFNKNYPLNDKGVEGDENYLFIDIFPLDAVPDDDNERAEFIKQVLKRRKYATVSRIKYGYLWKITKNKLLFIPKIFLKTFVKIKGVQKTLDSYIDFCSQYEVGKTKYVSSVIWGTIEKEKIRYEKTKVNEVPFEDTKMSVFEDYDFYLTNYYGNYMKRPEKSSREDHGIKIVEGRGKRKE